MGLFTDLKKILFGVKSVSKSAVKQGMEYTKETRSDIAQKAEDLGKTALDKTSGLRDAILHSAEGTINMVNKSETLKKAAETTERIGEKVLSGGEDMLIKGGELAENIGEKVISMGETILEKGEKTIESVGKKILGENNENLEKTKEFTSSVGSKVIDAKEKIVEKAKEVLNDMDEVIDETLERAAREETVEEQKPQKDLRDILKENEGPLVSDKDDFFEKAKQFADGNYDAVLEGQVTITNPGSNVKKETSKAAGFTDHDGDGNEIIDDAFIVSSEEE